MMHSQERRSCKRARLNHPVMMGIDGRIMRLAEILDAGKKGLRVRVTGQSGLQVGHEVEIFSLSAYKRLDASRFRCSIAWQDSDNFEVGLQYIQ